MKYLECDRCGAEYTDEPSVTTAEKEKETWAELCRGDKVEPRGIAPCPLLSCIGELLLREV